MKNSNRFYSGNRYIYEKLIQWIRILDDD